MRVKGEGFFPVTIQGPAQGPLTGQTLGHYRIAEKIGAGGMGEVYRAHDEHLDREVAIKVLPTGALFDDSSRKRFRKEALALSKLNHPNIATIHDFDTHHGLDFLVMEYIPGITLSEKLPAGALPEKEVLRLGIQLSDGLAAAHEHGVVHRDLKPGNLRLTSDGRLKILDFGLAKLRQPVAETAATESSLQTHSISGTLPYMAPEQLAGEEVDARTDIHGAGFVLYEMATGQRPFAEVQSGQLIGALLHREPIPPRTLNPKMSVELERIIGKCVEKDPGNRYQSAKELEIDLRRLQTGVASAVQPAARRARRPIAKWIGLGLGVLTTVLVLLIVLKVSNLRERLLGPSGAPQINSLAVLPLENLSGNTEQDYVADGIQEALITDLAKLSGIQRVIARSSVMRFRKTEKTPREIAHELGADALITGAVMRSGDRIEVTAHLIDAQSENQLWADRYESQFRDVLSLQNEVVVAITRAIRLQLTPQEQVHFRTARPVNPESHEAYLKGMFYLYKRTPEGFSKGLALLQQAIDKDPTDPLPYAGLAVGIAIIAHGSGSINPRTDFPRARAAALKAIELDDSSAEAHLALATVKLYFDYDWAGAEKEFRQALEINPNLADAHAHYGWYLLLFNRNEEAVAESKKAQQLDPLSAPYTAWMGWMYWDLGRRDEAMEEARKALDLDPNSPDGLYVLGGVYGDKGMFEQALAVDKKLAEVNPDWKYSLAETYAKAGRKAEALKIVAELEREDYAKYAGFIAGVQTLLGNKEETFRALEAAYEYHHIFLPWDMQDDSFPWKSDPRFQDMRRRMGLTQ
jgi:eukaryotic-like serine/threonine-protein kinase